MIGSNLISTPSRGFRAARALLALAAVMAALLSAAPARADIVSTRQVPHSGSDYSIAIGAVLWWDRWGTNQVTASSYAYVLPGSRTVSENQLTVAHAIYKSDGSFCADSPTWYGSADDPLHVYKTTDFTADVRRCGAGYYYLISWMCLRDAEYQYDCWTSLTYYLYMQ